MEVGRAASAWRVNALIIAIAIGIQSPVPAADPAKPLDLTGTWKEPNGTKVSLVQAGKSITLRTPRGRELRGQLSGTTLTLEGVFHGWEMAGAPDAVKAAIEAMHLKVKFNGSVEDKGRRIDATEVLPDDVRWDGDNKVTAVNTRYGHRVTFSRLTQIHVGKLNVDGYDLALRVEQRRIDNAIQDAQRTQATIVSGLAEQQNRYQAAANLAEQLHEKHNAILVHIDDVAGALAKLQRARPVVPKAARALYNQREQLERGLEQKLRLLEGSGGTPRDNLEAAIVSDFDFRDRLNAKLRPLLPPPPDITSQAAPLKAQLAQLDSQDLDLAKQSAHATTEMEIADHVLQSSQHRLAIADATITKLQLERYLLDGSLVQVDVRADGQLVYSAKEQGIAEELKGLDAQLEAVRKNVDALNEKRRTSADAFYADERNAIELGHRVESAIMKAAYARAAVDFGFNVYDVGKAAAKGGVAGALTETGKKVVEAVVFNAIDDALDGGNGNSYDLTKVFSDRGNPATGSKIGVKPESVELEVKSRLAAQHFDGKGFVEAVKDSVSGRSVLKVGAQRIVKEVDSKVLKAYAEKRWVEPAYRHLAIEPARRKLAELHGLVNGRLLAGQKVLKALNQMETYAAQLAKGVPASFKEYVLGKGFIAKNTKGAAIGETLVQESLKIALKAMADAYERQAYFEYFEADFKARAAYEIYRLAAVAYYDALDGVHESDREEERGYKDLRKERDDLVQDYDPRSGFKAFTNVPFYDDAKVVVVLHIEQPSGAKAVPVRVTVGGVEGAGGEPVYDYHVDAGAIHVDDQFAFPIAVHP